MPKNRVRDLNECCTGDNLYHWSCWCSWGCDLCWVSYRCRTCHQPFGHAFAKQYLMTEKREYKIIDESDMPKCARCKCMMGTLAEPVYGKYRLLCDDCHREMAIGKSWEARMWRFRCKMQYLFDEVYVFFLVIFHRRKK